MQMLTKLLKQMTDTCIIMLPNILQIVARDDWMALTLQREEQRQTRATSFAQVSLPCPYYLDKAGGSEGC